MYELSSPFQPNYHRLVCDAKWIHTSSLPKPQSSTMQINVPHNSLAFRSQPCVILEVPNLDMLEQGGTFHLSCNPVPTLLLIRLFSDCHTSLGNVKNFGNENSWSVTDAHLAFYSFAGLSILRRSSSILTISFDFLASTIMYTYYMKQNHHLMTFFAVLLNCTDIDGALDPRG